MNARILSRAFSAAVLVLSPALPASSDLPAPRDSLKLPPHYMRIDSLRAKARTWLRQRYVSPCDNMPIATPNPHIDYKMRIATRDPGIDYRMLPPSGMPPPLLRPVPHPPDSLGSWDNRLRRFLRRFRAQEDSLSTLR